MLRPAAAASIAETAADSGTQGVEEGDKTSAASAPEAPPPRRKRRRKPMTMEKAVPIADQIFMEIYQQCLLPRGMLPGDLFREIDADDSGEVTLEEFMDPGEPEVELDSDIQQ